MRFLDEIAGIGERNVRDTMVRLLVFSSSFLVSRVTVY